MPEPPPDSEREILDWPTYGRAIRELAAMIADSALREAYTNLIGSLTIYMGTGFTLMILVTYLPIMLILRLRTEAAGRENVPDEDIPGATYNDGIKTIVAILAPILASALGSFGDGILFN